MGLFPFFISHKHPGRPAQSDLTGINLYLTVDHHLVWSANHSVQRWRTGREKKKDALEFSWTRMKLHLRAVLRCQLSSDAIVLGCPQRTELQE